jgi:uroporphyrinogen III methyltransferase/synthase
VVLYDDLVSSAVMDYIPRSTRLIYVGKRAGMAAMAQEEIQRELVRLGLAGERVVRLKGGDPLIFGRGLEELLACQRAGIPAKIIPGITSALAAAAYAGISPTLRGVSAHVTIVTGHEAPGNEATMVDWEALAKVGGTLVILMGMGRLGRIVERLMGAGRSADTPVCIIQWGTDPRQKVVGGRLQTIVAEAEKNQVSSPAVIVVGEVAGEAVRVPWILESQPLFGVVVADTRTGNLGQDFADLVMEQGATVLRRPIQTVEAIGEPVAEEFLGREGDVLVFSSAPGVRFWLRGLTSLGKDGRALAGRRFMAVGETTAKALKSGGLTPDWVSEKPRQEGLLELILTEISREQSLRLVTGDKTDPWLAKTLRTEGYVVKEVKVYQSIENGLEAQMLVEDLAAHRVNAVVVTSGASAEILWSAFRSKNREFCKGHALWISIGPVTTKTMTGLGIPVHGEARKPGAEGLRDALLEAWATRGSHENPELSE